MSRRRFWFVLAIGLLAGLAYLCVSPIRQQLRMNAIQQSLSERDLALAQIQLEAYLHNDDTDAVTHLLAAQTARRNDDFATADRHLARYRELDGDKESIEMERLLRRSQLGDLNGATAAIQFCIRNPDVAIVPHMLEAHTRGYLAGGQPKLAKDTAEVWLKRNPTGGERGYALFLRGRSHEFRGEIPDALSNYRESLTANPKLRECKLALAYVLVRESPQDALPLFEQLQTSAFQPTEVRLGLARCYRQLGELERADTWIAALESEQPTNVAILVEAAKLALDQRRPADAELRLKRAISLVPKHRDANVQLARCLRDLGRDAEAAEQLATAQRIDDALFREPPAPEKTP